MADPHHLSQNVFSVPSDIELFILQLPQAVRKQNGIGKVISSKSGYLTISSACELSRQSFVCQSFQLPLMYRVWTWYLSGDCIWMD